MLNRSSDTMTTIAEKISGEIGSSVGYHIFFDFSVPSYFNEGFPVVKACREAGWRCTVMLEWSGRGLEEASRQCRDIGCTMVELPDELLYHVDLLALQAELRGRRHSGRNPSIRQKWFATSAVSMAHKILSAGWPSHSTHLVLSEIDKIEAIGRVR